MRGKTHCTIGILASIQTCILFNIPISIINLLFSAFFSILPDLDEPNSTISKFFFVKKIPKKSLKNIIYFLSAIIFIVSLSFNNSIYVSFLIFVFLLIFNESKFNETILKKFFISFLIILISLISYIVTKNIYIGIFWLFISVFPWLKHRGFSHSIFAIILLYYILKKIEITYNISNLSILGLISYSSHIFLGDIFTKNGVKVFYPIFSQKISFSKFPVGSRECNTLEYIFISLLVILIFINI